jgi:predicted nuclease with TOPRIM domain
METEKLIKAYIKLRDARSELKSEYTEKDNELLEKQERIEAVLLEHAKENNLTNMKTKAGTAFLRTKTRYWASNWEAFSKWLATLGDEGYSMVEQRIQQSNFKQFLEENPDVIPPVNSDSKLSIVVRRA